MNTNTTKNKAIVPAWRADREDTKARRTHKQVRSARRSARRQIMAELQGRQ